jgi:hypothetical protein
MFENILIAEDGVYFAVTFNVSCVPGNVSFWILLQQSTYFQTSSKKHPTETRQKSVRLAPENPQQQIRALFRNALHSE